MSSVGGPKPKVAHRFYHVPASNTAVGHLILENAALRLKPRPELVEGRSSARKLDHPSRPAARAPQDEAVNKSKIVLPRCRREPA